MEMYVPPGHIPTPGEEARFGEWWNRIKARDSLTPQALGVLQQSHPNTILPGGKTAAQLQEYPVNSQPGMQIQQRPEGPGPHVFRMGQDNGGAVQQELQPENKLVAVSYGPYGGTYSAWGGAVQQELQRVTQQLSQLPAGSPEAASLLQRQQALQQAMQIISVNDVTQLPDHSMLQARLGYLPRTQLQ